MKTAWRTLVVVALLLAWITPETGCTQGEQWPKSYVQVQTRLAPIPGQAVAPDPLAFQTTRTVTGTSFNFRLANPRLVDRSGQIPTANAYGAQSVPLPAGVSRLIADVRLTRGLNPGKEQARYFSVVEIRNEGSRQVILREDTRPSESLGQSHEGGRGLALHEDWQPLYANQVVNDRADKDVLADAVEYLAGQISE